jgi:hypothetical protein
MKKILFLSCTLIITLFVAGDVSAQAKSKVEISSVKQKAETVRFMLSSSKPFMVGDNRYILHIGDKEFSRYEQSKNNGKGYITFLMYTDDFDKLENDKKVYLTYGSVSEEADMEKLSKQSARCWSLGKFSKGLLTK